ncbi:MAG: FapA family protein, partial [Oscillospiraceae bacterium]
MINQESDTIRVEDILADPIMRAHPAKHCNKTLLMHQLIDPTLMGLDLDRVSEMDVEELASTVLLAQDWVLNEQAELVAMMEFEQANQSSAQETPLIGEPEYGETLVHITFDSRYLEASVLLTEPEEDYAPPTAENLRAALLRRGVIRGVKDDYVERLAAHPIYNRPFRIAQGEAPINGENGRVIYHFEPVFTLAPTIGADGSADYKALNYVQNVKKGDLLCEIVPPTVGVSGFSVRGEMLTGLVGKSASLICGRNTTLSDDRRKLYASCDGQVFLKGATVYVSRILELENVDASTGNILFVGTVHVRGDIASGFSVRASSDIVVDGIAENAVLVAGNDIIICGG